MRRIVQTTAVVILLVVLGPLTTSSGAKHRPWAARLEAPSVKTVRVRGTDLAYVEQGRGEPVVLLHGWLWDYRAWSEQVTGLSKHYRVIAYSRRYNYPNSPTGGGADYSIQTDTADLVALIKALKLRRVHLVGHSAGGSIALLVARDHPELVRSVVLGEAFMEGLLAQNSEAQVLLNSLGGIVDQAHRAFQKDDLRGAARILADGIVGKSGAFDQTPAERQSQVLDNMRLEMKAELSAPATPEPPFTCQDAQRIKVPTLLIEGERTIRIAQLMDEEFLKCISGSMRKILPGATHALQLEKPVEFNQLVLEFLDRHSGPS